MRTERFLPLAAYSCFAVALTLAGVEASSPLVTGEGSVWMVHGALLAVTLLLLALGRLWVRQLDHRWPALIHPPVLVTLYGLLLLGVPGLLSTRYPAVFPVEKHGIPLQYVTWGWSMIVLGLLALWAGYLAGFVLVRPGRARGWRSPADLSAVAVLLLYGSGLAVAVAMIAVTGIQYGSDQSALGGGAAFGRWIGYIEQARYIGFAIIAMKFFAKREMKGWLAGALAVEFILGLTSGMIKPVLWLGVTLLLAAAVSGHSLRRYRALLVVAPLAVVLVVPVSEGIRRGVVRFDTRSPVDAAAASWRLIRLTWVDDPGTAWTLFLQKVPGRQVEVAAAPGVILAKTPAMLPHEGWGEFLKVPLYMMPRAVWREKPVLNRGKWFSVTYRNLPSSTQTSSAMTVFGDGFVFAGWGGAAAAGLIMGLLMAVIFRKTMGAGAVPVLITLTPTFIDVEGAFTTTVLELVQGALVFTAVYLVLQFTHGLFTRRRIRPLGVHPPYRLLHHAPVYDSRNER